MKLKTGTIARKTQGSIQIYQPLAGEWQYGLGTDHDVIPESAAPEGTGVFRRMKARTGRFLANAFLKAIEWYVAWLRFEPVDEDIDGHASDTDGLLGDPRVHIDGSIMQLRSLPNAFGRNRGVMSITDMVRTENEGMTFGPHRVSPWGR